LTKEERSFIAFERTLKTISDKKGHFDNQTLNRIIYSLCFVPLYVGIKIDEKTIENDEFTLLTIKMRGYNIIPLFTSVEDEKKGTNFHLNS